MSFKKILIANRGEIACRVIRTAKNNGYATVAVYSDADRQSLHVRQADESVYIGPSAAKDSYLKIENIIDAAQKSGADAIHPGYGFLSENADFAKACQAAGIVFIGPPENAIVLMGDKRASKVAMIQSGVPCVPGYQDTDQADETLEKEGKKIGFPLMVKASAGGGGRGMRLVEKESDLAESIKSARSEAQNAFGSGELILEKAIVQPRHVEIQVFGDSHGNVIHLGERDCSVQRRHQKVIEESPSPFIDEKRRAEMGEAAVLAAKACDYVGAGTVEFIVDESGDFYFLEMNTRLQVEHPVTELVTGFDLVDWQFRIAAGEPLPVAQDDVELSGYAIEARLYAEDPAQQFMPQTGRLVAWEIDPDLDVRLDSGVRSGDVITPFYDPMVAKLVAHGKTRDEARRKLIAALDRASILGLNSNKTYLQKILEHDVFAAGGATTAFVQDHMGDATTGVMSGVERWLLPALAFYFGNINPDADRGWIGWRSASVIDTMFKLENGDDTACVSIGVDGQRDGVIQVRLSFAENVDSLLDAETPEHCNIAVHSWGHGSLKYAIDDAVSHDVRYVLEENAGYFDLGAGNHVVENVTHRPPESSGGAGSGTLIAPLDGAVIDVRTEAGASVAVGDVLAVVEAMKMEHQIKADLDGVVNTVHIKVGDQVKTKQVLIELDGESDPDSEDQ